MVRKESFLYQKIRDIWNKHTDEGTPRKIIESNMAREFRLCREEVRKVIEEMHLENEMMLRRKRVKRETKVAYSPSDNETYLEELKMKVAR